MVKSVVNFTAHPSETHFNCAVSITIARAAQEGVAKDEEPRTFGIYEWETIRQVLIDNDALDPQAAKRVNEKMRNLDRCIEFLTISKGRMIELLEG